MMSTLLQTCPECSSSLELPSDSVGRLAKCPTCQATFRIGETETEPDATEDRFQVAQVAIEEIVAPTWALFRNNWLPSIISGLIVGAAGVVFLGLPIWVLSTMAGGNQQLYAVIGVMLMIPYSLLISAYALVGLCRVHLAIARGESEPLKEIMPPSELVLRFLPSYLMISLAIAAIFGVGIGAVVVAAAANQPQLANLIGIIVAFALMVVVTVVQWYLWAWMLAASDGKCTALGSLKVAVSITLRNKLSSFLIVIIAVVLSLVGSLACYVGHVVTSPLTLLMFAVGYLLTTNQPIAHPDELSS
ncbi:hypothetical protein [Planctomycetes bacterium K23_9]